VNPTKRVTIREVADAAGVSPAAVSYALRGLQVSEETQKRVRQVATELGYEANPIARALASGRSGMVGILGPSLEDLWQQRLVAEAGRVLFEHERYGLILDAGADRERQRILAGQLRDQQVDGLILFPVDPSDPFWSELAAALPVVSIGERLAGAAAAGEVLFDNRAGALRAGAPARSRPSPARGPAPAGIAHQRSAGRAVRRRRGRPSEPGGPGGHRSLRAGRGDRAGQPSAERGPAPDGRVLLL
jgi:LacI family transcriptional regulator